jgi:hypothetical protein
MLIAITVGAKNRQVENRASRKPRMRQTATPAWHASFPLFARVLRASDLLSCSAQTCAPRPRADGPEEDRADGPQEEALWGAGGEAARRLERGRDHPDSRGDRQLRMELLGQDPGVGQWPAPE